MYGHDRLGLAFEAAFNLVGNGIITKANWRIRHHMFAVSNPGSTKMASRPQKTLQRRDGAFIV
jgi:hypothetical protein